MILIEDKPTVSYVPLMLPSGITYGAEKPQERRKRLRPWVHMVGLAAALLAAGIFE